MHIIRNLTLCLLSTYLVGCASVERLAIPKADLYDSALEETGQQSDVNHSVWRDFLNSHTIKDSQGIVRVAYAEISRAEHQNLKNYIQSLSKIDTKSLSRNTQLAYWANLYNALTIDVILDNYPVNSIRNIKDGFFDVGPWENKRLSIQGKKISLHDIEHNIVRALWKDTPEIHYLLNCAAAGCPNLSQISYDAENVQKIMQQAAIEYVNSQRGVVVFDDGSIALSKIYSWYIDDFGGSEKEILNHIKLYANSDLNIALQGRPIIRQYFYDWGLNDQKLSNSLVLPIFNDVYMNE